MGDRCYLTINIHGHVDTVEKLQAIIKALRDQCLTAEDAGEEDAAYYSEFRRSVNDQTEPQFMDYECNYADISPVERQLQELGVPYYVSHEEGGNYGPGCWSWSPDTGKTERPRDKDGGAFIPTPDLRRMLAQPNPLRLIREEVQRCDRAEGVGLPPFSVSPEVRAFFYAQDKDDSCPECAETAQDGSGTCVTCGAEMEG